VDNAYSLLDQTDLVFIDPVSTGYSRAVPGGKPDPYHKFEGDIASVGQFIRQYTTRHKRWASPKLLAGESYGTTRAAGLSGYLQSECGMFLNGIVLVSAVLQFQSISFDHGNDLPYVLFLPSYAATAWYHGKLAPELGDLAQVTARAETFARGAYTAALFQGSALPAAEREAVVQELARLTGLSCDYVERSYLRIAMDRFAKELLRAEGRTIGRFDSRILGRDRDGVGEQADYDPSYAIVQGAYTAALNHYLRAELGFKSELPYEILTGRVQPWDYGKFQNQYVDVSSTLRLAMMRNPDLRVFVANGTYDLATPYFATEYTMNHLGLPEEQVERVSMAYYPAGHMMYTDERSLAKLKGDLDAFYRAVVGK
jgi:carboxypeptidase C (cathepsin A)